MGDIEIIREWLAKADENFEFALVNLEEGKAFFALICFHFQQAAEKYLKAYIVAHDLEFRKIHDLPALLKTCTRKNSSLEQLNSDCEFLNAFYIETRYPVHWPTHFTRQEAAKAKSAADRVRQVITEALSPFL
jgi:HEPN domain-containing protein